MKSYDLLQLELFMLALLVLTKPMGLYLCRALDAEGKTPLDRILGPLERFIYRILGVDAKIEQDWKSYTMSLVGFSLVGALATYAILRLQHMLPLNPQSLAPPSESLAFNTAVSFTTNTNWQSYAGEVAMSYFSQMAGLTFHNFASAAVGIAVAAALVRGIARNSAKTVGNFWTDLVRINLYVLLPLSIVFALFLVSQGVVQNFRPYVTTHVLEQPVVEAPKKDAAGQVLTDEQGPALPAEKKAETQTIVQGPMASQIAIKMLGTNGGGFVNANAAHPYENPTPLSNFLQMLAIFLIPGGLTYYLGRTTGNQRHGWSVWAVMALLFIAAVLVCSWAEINGNPRLHSLGLDPAGGNMEGKEVRFGVFNSALFAAVTTAASCGAVNSMHDAFTPLGGLAPLLNIQLGEVIFGGVGSGLYGMLVFIILTVFLSGLMIGRTPEYLGKKIEAGEVKLCVLFVMVPVFTILGFTAISAVTDQGVATLGNAGPHGFTEILYAYSSAAGNNGSAFAGLGADNYWYNTTLGIAMLCGRFLMIVPALALAGILGKKKLVAQGPGSFPVTGATFIILLSGTVLLVGALTFFPALSVGPILEHFIMTGSGTVF